MAAAEKKEMNARKRKTLASLKRITASPPPRSDSEDLSEVEEGVTAALLAGLKMKKKPVQGKESEVQRSSEIRAQPKRTSEEQEIEMAPPRRTGRKRVPKSRDD